MLSDTQYRIRIQSLKDDLFRAQANRLKVAQAFYRTINLANSIEEMDYQGQFITWIIELRAIANELAKAVKNV